MRGLVKNYPDLSVSVQAGMIALGKINPSPVATARYTSPTVIFPKSSFRHASRYNSSTRSGNAYASTTAAEAAAAWQQPLTAAAVEPEPDAYCQHDSAPHPRITRLLAAEPSPRAAPHSRMHHLAKAMVLCDHGVQLPLFDDRCPCRRSSLCLHAAQC